MYGGTTTITDGPVDQIEGANGSDATDSGARNYGILDQLLQICCLELMASYGLPATRATAAAISEPPTSVLVAAIDFSGRDLRGTIALRMTNSIVVETYRTAVGETVDPASVAAGDWACELVNQLIGRWKNQLRSYNVTFNVNLPRRLPLFPVAELERALRSRFVSDRGTFSGYLDVMITPGFAFLDSPPEEPLVGEGDLVLF